MDGEKMDGKSDVGREMIERVRVRNHKNSNF